MTDAAEDRGGRDDRIERKKERIAELLTASKDPESSRALSVYLLLLRGFGAGSPELEIFGVSSEDDLRKAVQEAERHLETNGKAPRERGAGEGESEGRQA